MSGAEYFLTICTEQRRAGLTQTPLVGLILEGMHALESERQWHVRTATIMPDHVHLLITLGASADLSDVVRSFKGRLTPVLRRAGISWQRAYFDHRLRADEDRRPVFHYIFMNPYRAALQARHHAWPAYYCCREDSAWFQPLTDDGLPVPEWLA